MQQRLGSQVVLDFWFKELQPSQWWKKDDDFDRLITARFSDIYRQAACCELYHWRETSQGRLAEIIVLDQFPRNMFRGTPASFASDPLALALSQEAIAKGADQDLSSIERVFLTMPFMHSEALAIHELAVDLYSEIGLQNNLDFEIKHKVIIERFGRYPHRNSILGRESTDEEQEFLTQAGSSF